MKNALSVSSLIISLIALFVSLFLNMKKEKVVYVDSLKLISNYSGSKALKKQFDLKAAQWKLNLDTLATELSNEMAAYEKGIKSMSAKDKLAAEKSIDLKKEQFENYQKVINENFQKEDKRITAQVFNEITMFLKKYGQQNHYDFIMGATNTGNIVYADKKTDITDEVLLQLNKNYKAK